ncbi:MAG: hypothetical protein JSS30_07120 [Verrucomicrobia bacterium]|nr:hypothetical protein [Verrucomicrobiota bacterium]
MVNTVNELRRKVAWLESKVDMLETELLKLNAMLIDCGFPEGVETLKATIQDLLAEANDPSSQFPPEDDRPHTQFA